MQIIAGQARNILLSMPDGKSVRATPVRSRKAMFDSIGDLSGARVADLFAGSGALGLEASSRGAVAATFIELERSHCRLIEENITRVKRAGVVTEFKLVCADATKTENYCHGVAPDYVFADPPYAESGKFFRLLTADDRFKQWMAGGTLIWEVPDFGDPDGSFLSPVGWELRRRQYGNREFIFAKL